jgi:hypothetical protein
MCKDYIYHMGGNSRDAWAMVKNGPEPLLHQDKMAYRQHKGACGFYRHWTAAYSEEEIARFFQLPVREVLLDIEHIQAVPTRSVIAQENDRNRILLQRAEAELYRNLLSEAPTLPIGPYLAARISLSQHWICHSALSMLLEVPDIRKARRERAW